MWYSENNLLYNKRVHHYDICSFPGSNSYYIYKKEIYDPIERES